MGEKGAANGSTTAGSPCSTGASVAPEIGDGAWLSWMGLKPRNMRVAMKRKSSVSKVFMGRRVVLGGKEMVERGFFDFEDLF